MFIYHTRNQDQQVIDKGQSIDANSNITVLPDRDIKTAIINVPTITSIFETNGKIKYLSK